MTQRSVHVVRPGLLTTVQDLGRWGSQANGVPVAGPMDWFSHRLANALLDNPRDAAALEITFVGPELHFGQACTVAIAGAEFAVMAGGRTAPHGEPFEVSAGARLTFGERLRGARAYLAIDGGIGTPLLLGSRSTHVPSGMGGLAGRALQKDDVLPIDGASGRRSRSRRQNRHAGDMLSEPAVARVVRGPDEERFGAEAFHALQSAPYTISADSDRMGFRLHGPAIAAAGADIISDATPMGTVQVTGAGQPTVLMADRQTTGGYSRIATVITADLGIIGQRAAGDVVSFRLCTMADALAALIARENALLAVEGERA